MSETRLEQLLKGLAKHDFEVVHVEADQAVIKRREDDASFILTASATWVSAMQMLFEDGELRASKHASAAFRFAMQLHGRYTGCRFGFDEDENLCVQYDIYPDVSPEHVALALTQMHYVGSACVPLFEVVLAGGTVDDHLIERAFGDDDDDSQEN